MYGGLTRTGPSDELHIFDLDAGIDEGHDHDNNTYTDWSNVLYLLSIQGHGLPRPPLVRSHFHCTVTHSPRLAGTELQSLVGGMRTAGTMIHTHWTWRHG